MEKIDFDALEDGHPITILRMENAEIAQRTTDLQEELASDPSAAFIVKKLEELQAIRSHYGKTEELLLMPLLYQYGVTGPCCRV